MAQPVIAIGTIEDGHEYMGGPLSNTSSWKEWGAGAKRYPDGSIGRDLPSGRREVLKVAPKTPATQRFTDAQTINAQRAARMLAGQRNYEAALKRGYNPTSLRNKIASVGGMLPLGLGLPTQMFIRNPVSEMGLTGETQFTEGALRAATGAGLNKEERPVTEIQLFPTPFSSGDPINTAALNRDREGILATAVRAAGPALATLPQVRNNADFAKLPSGQSIKFIDPQGQIRVKP